MNYPPTAIAKAAKVRLIIFDVDGVLTDGSITYTSNGTEIKSFNVQDGAALKMLMESGVECAIITGRTSPMVGRRARELGIQYVFEGADDKAAALSKLCHLSGCATENMAHMGDDIPDIPLFNRVSFAVSVPTAHPEVSKRAHYISEALPGKGAVREVCHLIMTAQKSWPKLIAAIDE